MQSTIQRARESEPFTYYVDGERYDMHVDGQTGLYVIVETDSDGMVREHVPDGFLPESGIHIIAPAGQKE